MPERLDLTLNAQFYIPTVNITDDIINKILDEADQNIEPESEHIINIFRQETLSINGTFNYKYSLRIFPTLRDVYFFDDDIHDRIYAFILLLEYNNHISILKKSCAQLTHIIEDYFEQISSEQLASTFDDDAVEYQKLSVRDMNISDKALKRRSYEASDLKGLLSTHSAGRSIPYYYKIKQGSKFKSISSNTARMVESSQRLKIDDVAQWVKKQIDLVTAPAQGKSFLNNFAKRIQLADVLEVTKPIAILIESSSVMQRIEDDGLIVKYTLKNGSEIKLNNRALHSLYKQLEQIYDISNDNSIECKDISARIRINKNTIGIWSNYLKKHKVVINGKAVTLQKFITKYGYFSICFDNPSYMYFMNSCFLDSSGVSEIDSILDLLTPINGMNKIKSEKGEFKDKQVDFDDDSLFSLVEKHHATDDYIICDDLGNEWADHITLHLTEPSISFIHSKHGDITTSASKLHDVVGQGIKNIGNMHFTENSIKNKIDNKFNETYAKTEINRIRKSGNLNILEAFNSLRSNYRLERKCILCCSFISKKSIKDEFQKIKDKVPVSGHIVQLLWILSSFAHAARDSHIIPIVYCSE
ncbi:hypothetical protein ACX1H4_14920 [Yersinia enterocolitica]|uniref:hypothetical protein n=1 Tax=Yersinia TaxID=629 RepID=UPI0005DD9CC4|nr:hypothetical protein [Yersinia frederiksenii]ELI8020179.1 hypothetical protein [Yersinia enterocolitica]ELW8197276.1 hypothetical protein [Yersinia enterocolitica]CNK60415.1 Uncharacterised protein [Yersinia frederiksenii]HDV7528420.1 hypothetical protein [Yersinia enterocolitica]